MAILVEAKFSYSCEQICKRTGIDGINCEFLKLCIAEGRRNPAIYYYFAFNFLF